jgi:hypothetical protein
MEGNSEEIFPAQLFQDNLDEWTDNVSGRY